MAPLSSPTAGMRALFAFACLAAFSSPVPSARAQSRESAAVGDAELERELWRLLDEATRRGTVLEEIVERIVRKGPGAVPALFAILCGELTGAGDGDVSARDWVIVDALSRMPSAAVIAHLRDVMATEPATDVRLSAMLVLSNSPDLRTAEIVIEVLADVDPTHLASSYVARRAEESVARTLERHPRVIRRLDPAEQPLPAPLLPIVVSALPEEEAVESTRFLVGLFGRSDELDVQLMRRLSEFAGSPFGVGDLWTAEDSLDAVRDHLDHPDWRMRREAVVALGYLHDVQAYPALIRLLDDPERSVQRASQWTLEHIAGRSLADAAAWTRLFQHEDAWLLEVLPGLEERLTAGSDAVVVEAVRELSRRPLYRHLITEVLAPHVGRGNPVIVEVVCGALVQLDSPRAVPTLVLALEHPDSRSRKAVWKALKSISGRSFAPTRETWENELGL